MIVLKVDNRKNNHYCKICGELITNDKTRPKEYCKDCNVEKIKNNLTHRYLSNTPHPPLNKELRRCDKVKFNLNYEINNLEKLAAEVGDNKELRETLSLTLNLACTLLKKVNKLKEDMEEKI